MVTFLFRKRDYVKKKEAPNFYKFQSTIIGLSLISVSIVTATLYFFPLRKIHTVFSDFQFSPPILSELTYALIPLFFVYTLGSGIVILFSKTDPKKLEKKLQRYKATDKISPSSLPPSKFEFVALMIAGMVVVLTIANAISSINSMYYLSEQF